MENLWNWTMRIIPIKLILGRIIVSLKKQMVKGTYFSLIQKGDIYLLNRNGQVKYTNCKTSQFRECLLDGEYITKDKEGNNMRLFLVFDIYFCNGRDLERN